MSKLAAAARARNSLVDIQKGDERYGFPFFFRSQPDKKLATATRRRWHPIATTHHLRSRIQGLSAERTPSFVVLSASSYGSTQSVVCPGLPPSPMLLRQSSVTASLRLLSFLTRRPFHASACYRASSMRVIPIPVRKDNYSYLIVDDTAKEAAAVDPYTPSKVKEAADQLGVRVIAGLTTHHHHDHSGGNQVCSPLPQSFFRLTSLQTCCYTGICACTNHSLGHFPSRIAQNTSSFHFAWRPTRPSYSRVYRFTVAVTRALP